MKTLNITYDATTVENGEWVVGETCCTVEIGDDEVADRLLDHGSSGIAVRLIERMLESREILLCRHYVPGSIKHYELVKEDTTHED